MTPDYSAPNRALTCRCPRPGCGGRLVPDGEDDTLRCLLCAREFAPRGEAVLVEARR